MYGSVGFNVTRRSRILTTWAPAALLALFGVSAALSARLDAVTFDETAHLPAGLSYLQRGEFRMNPEHPPLAKAWAALPLALFGPPLADYRSAAWQSGDAWRFGYETLYGPLGSPERRDPRAVALAARAMMIVPALGLGLLVFVWSREIWGAGGGLLSLAFFALSPTMLAHARLVTTDLPVALGFVATVWCFSRALQRPSVPWTVAAGLALGAALLVKFTAVLLPPILAGAILVERARRRRSGERPLAPLHAVGTWVAVCLLAWGCVWVGYGLRVGAPEIPERATERPAPPSSGRALEATVGFATRAHLLPEAWLKGMSLAARDATYRLGYLDGETSVVGWWRYFPEAFALKTAPATLAGLLWLAAWLAASGRWRDPRLWLVALPLVVYAAVSIGSRLNIGHRHLTPLYPFLFVALGGLVEPSSRNRVARAGLGLIVAAAIATFAVATPRHLSYFNFLAGGARGGARHLLDSNLDWGQDLGRLATWMRRERLDRIPLAYFGTADPEAYGIAYDKVARVPDFQPERPRVRPGPGELVAVSANLLHGLYVEEDELLANALLRRRAISRADVEEWLAGRDLALAERRSHPGLAAWLVAERRVPDASLRAVRRTLLSGWLEDLRDSGRLEARVGDSILVYRVP